MDDTGSRAIHVKALPGSRAEADVVPTFVLNHVVWVDASRIYHTIHGVGILSKDGTTWTLNFPHQHNTNGAAKRGRTKHRFKRCVRMLKRLRNEMADAGVQAAKPIPSYLIECLAYRVDDFFYTDDNDDHHNRIYWIIRSLQELTVDSAWLAGAAEINDVKGLFGSWQGWTAPQVVAFLSAARAYLED